MRIGTPLSPGAMRVMLLGSGELGKEVAIAFQRLGVEVIAVDRYENAPAHQVSHHQRVIDMSDAVALRQLIAEEKPDIIVPEIEAIATEVLLEAEEQGGIRVIPTARATELTMNREGIRRLAAEELGIPTSKYAFIDDPTELERVIDADIGYPCVIKPAISSSGKGQSVVEGPEDIDSAIDYAVCGGRVRTKRIIVEAFVDFDFEITLLTVRSRTSEGYVTSFCAPIGHRQSNGDYVESWQPQPMSDVALAKAQDIAKRVTDALGGRGLFGVEFFVKDDDVIFSEVSPRPHDTGMVTMVTQAQNEFELHARAVLNLPLSTELRNPGASAVIYGKLEEEGISYAGVDEALDVPETEIRLFGKPVSFRERRMGVALARAENIDKARENATKAAKLVRPVRRE